MKKSKLFPLLLLLMSLNGFSQKLIVDGDTALCFTLEQSRYLLAQVYKVEEQSLLLNNKEEVIDLQAQIIKTDFLTIEELKKVMENLKMMIALKDDQIKILTLENIKMKKKVRKEKVLRWIATGAAGLVLIFAAVN